MGLNSSNVPAALDYISVDLYRGGGSAEVGYAKAFYEKHVFNKLLPHQRALIVPGTFACTNTTYESLPQ